jgi:homoserine kinase
MSGSLLHFPSPVVRVSAPATVTSLGPGFGVFGLALKDAPHNIVSAALASEWIGAKLETVTNGDDLPRGPNNIVESVAQRVLEFSGKRLGIKLTLNKGISLRNGLGSSAASSVAAALAVNEVIGCPFKRTSQEILDAVVYGESIASGGTGHAGSVIPALYGGFRVIHDARHHSFSFDIKPWWYFVIVSLRLNEEEKRNRFSLNEVPYNLVELVRFQRAFLKKYIQTGFRELSGLQRKRRDLLREGGTLDAVEQYLRGSIDVINGIREADPRLCGAGMMADTIITPLCAKRIPGFDRAKKSALDNGAFGLTLCGLGPSIIALTDGIDKGTAIGGAIRKIFLAEGYEASVFMSEASSEGANISDRFPHRSRRTM